MKRTRPSPGKFVVRSGHSGPRAHAAPISRGYLRRRCSNHHRRSLRSRWLARPGNMGAVAAAGALADAKRDATLLAEGAGRRRIGIVTMASSRASTSSRFLEGMRVSDFARRVTRGSATTVEARCRRSQDAGAQGSFILLRRGSLARHKRQLKFTLPGR